MKPSPPHRKPKKLNKRKQKEKNIEIFTKIMLSIIGIGSVILILMLTIVFSAPKL